MVPEVGEEFESVDEEAEKWDEISAKIEGQKITTIDDPEVLKELQHFDPMFSGLNLFELFDGKKSKLFELIKLSSNSANLVFAGLLSPIS